MARVRKAVTFGAPRQHCFSRGAASLLGLLLAVAARSGPFRGERNHLPSDVSHFHPTNQVQLALFAAYYRENDAFGSAPRGRGAA